MLQILDLSIGFFEYEIINKIANLYSENECVCVGGDQRPFGTFPKIKAGTLDTEMLKICWTLLEMYKNISQQMLKVLHDRWFVDGRSIPAEAISSHQVFLPLPLTSLLVLLLPYQDLDFFK